MMRELEDCFFSKANVSYQRDMKSAIMAIIGDPLKDAVLRQ
jgi:hypothetical protein